MLYTFRDILVSDISDHFPVYCISDSDLVCTNPDIRYSKRVINEKCILEFINLLHSKQWSYDFDGDVNKNYNRFLSEFTSVYDICFPIKCTYSKSNRSDKPWFTNELRKMCKKKCRMYKMFIKNPTQYRKDVYKRLRNKVTNEIILAKKQYYAKRLHGSLMVI